MTDADRLAREQEIQRYEMYLDHPRCGYECCGGGTVSPEPDKDGPWVYWDDVQAAIAAERQARERLEQKIEAWLIREGPLKARLPLVQVKRKPTHGNCCTCQECGQYHDDFLCEQYRLWAEWRALLRVAGG